MARLLRALAFALALLLGHAEAQIINPAVIEATIETTVCASGWARGIRPPTSYTRPIKRALFNAARDAGDLKAGETIASFELDHITPIVLGGHPRDRRNLRLQRWHGPDGAYAKDAVERYLARRVCGGHATLAAAQRCISRDWSKCAPASRGPIKIENRRTE
jgi:hypothetical protein